MSDSLFSIWNTLTPFLFSFISSLLILNVLIRDHAKASLIHSPVVKRECRGDVASLHFIIIKSFDLPFTKLAKLLGSSDSQLTGAIVDLRKHFLALFGRGF